MEIKIEGNLVRMIEDIFSIENQRKLENSIETSATHNGYLKIQKIKNFKN